MKITIKTLTEMLDASVSRIEDLEREVIVLQSKVEKDRGPASLRKMTEDDARRLILGDMIDISHKNAAKTLGLSYAQVYSARGGYTFKSITEEKLKSLKK